MKIEVQLFISRVPVKTRGWPVPRERGKILNWTDDVDPLISEPPEENVAQQAGHCLEDQGVLEAGGQPGPGQGGLGGGWLDLVLVHSRGLQQVLITLL